jgi:rare lipoprotein A
MLRGSKLCVVTLIFLLLSSCANINKQSDMADHGKKSNSSYSIFGKTYTVMKSSKNYEEKGIASWYGRRFNKKRTSSGERYNMHGLTAAHKTLPFATRVQVTNVKNGRKVIVRINDRGPFVRHRMIDLSYAAAKKIGILGHGLAEVHVKALDSIA